MSANAFNAPVAQLDRVSASEAEGRAFESRQVRHFLFCLCQSLLNKRAAEKLAALDVVHLISAMNAMPSTCVDRR